MPNRPSVVAFDVVETLMSLEPLGRLEGRYGGLFAPADVTGADLTEVADGLLALPARG
jgi:hypothetical protein